MTRTLCALVTLWLVAASASSAAAQTSRIESGSTSLGNFVFYYETRLEPPVPPLGDGLNMLVLTTSPATVHRVMLDRARRLYFGYDARLSVIRQAVWNPGDRGGVTRIQSDDQVYAVEFGPLSMTPELEKVLGPDAATWTQMATPRFGEALARIRAGEAIEITLLANSTWGQTMTEYVTVESAPPPAGFAFPNPTRREFAFAPGAARDISAADIELRLDEPVVRVGDRGDSKVQTSDGNTWTRMGGTNVYRTRDETVGSIVWVYVPERGRFVLSLTPRRDFSRAGTVRGTTLSFTVDGFNYSLTSAERIASGTAAFNLYVLHQPAWRPSYQNANLDTIHIGAADRAEYLSGK